MKPKQILAGLAALWAAVALLEGISSLFRRVYSRNMRGAALAASGAVHYGKAAAMVALALSNVFLFMRYFDERR